MVLPMPSVVIRFYFCRQLVAARRFSIRRFPSGENRKFKQYGMTLLEVLIAFSMFVVFGGVVAMVMEFTNRFFDDAGAGGKGVLIEHVEIQATMDSLVEVLSQPGISLEQVRRISSQYVEPIPLPPCVAPLENVAKEWELPMPETTLADKYSLCLWSTEPLETSISPGVYVLQALPNKVKASKLPTRRLFCRPRPFC